MFKYTTEIKMISKYQYKINQARIKSPLKKTILFNPIISIMLNEFGEELPDSKLRNEMQVEKFLFKLESAYKYELALRL
jgi:hypothetical protein